jgi:hypothetical protein
VVGLFVEVHCSKRNVVNDGIARCRLKAKEARRSQSKVSSRLAASFNGDGGAPRGAYFNTSSSYLE